MPMRNPLGTRSNKIRFWALVCVLGLWLAAIEGIAWAAFLFGPSIGSFVVGSLDPYEVEVPGIPGHWRLRPDYNVSRKELIAAKLASGKWLGVEAIRAEAGPAVVPGRLSINTHGFKGPPIKTPKTCSRIITIGDSVTFGIGTLSYPMFMQQRFDEIGIGVEVINVGVEGYKPSNALYEIDRYRALQPDIALILIGWNELFRLDRYSLYKTPWLLRRTELALKQVMSNSSNSATHLYKRNVSPNLEDPEIKKWSESPLPFLKDVEALIRRLKQDEVDVYLISLYGLFSSSEAMSDSALQKGHLPQFTDNPYVFKAMTENYNRQLKKISQKMSVNLIELDVWGREHLLPPEAYFFDSVHFNAVGLQRVGTYLADVLKSSQSVSKHHCKRD